MSSVSALYRLGPALRSITRRRAKKPGPLSLFLHGYVDSWRSFAGVIEALPREYRAVALDLRGHGDSDKPECCYAMEDFAQDLLLFMDALELDKANLVGHSMGSFIAQSFAARCPGRVERLILISSAPGTAAEKLCFGKSSPVSMRFGTP